LDLLLEDEILFGSPVALDVFDCVIICYAPYEQPPVDAIIFGLQFAQGLVHVLWDQGAL
jgi:hypothetical protein